MSSCQPSSNNLPLYFQSIVPSISPVSDNNTILYATTGSLPSYIPFNRIWNFICNGTFSGPTVSVFFDASELIEKCPDFVITFEGKIYGQLTFGRCDYQLQKYVTSRVVQNSTGRVTGIIFDITKPTGLNQERTHEFYFNLLLNDDDTDGSTYNAIINYGTPANVDNSSIQYNWDGAQYFQLLFISSQYTQLRIILPPSTSTCPVFYLEPADDVLTPPTYFLNSFSTPIGPDTLYYYNDSTWNKVSPTPQTIPSPPTSQSQPFSLDFGTLFQYDYQYISSCQNISTSWQNCSTISFQLQLVSITYYFAITALNAQVTTLSFIASAAGTECNAGTIIVVFSPVPGYTLSPSKVSITEPYELKTIKVTPSPPS